MKREILNFKQWRLNEQSKYNDVISRLRSLSEYGYGANGITVLEFIENTNRDYDHIGEVIVSEGSDLNLIDTFVKSIDSYVSTKDVNDLNPIVDYISKDQEMSADSDPYGQGTSWLFSKLLTALYYGSIDGEDIIYAPNVDSFADNENSWDEWDSFTDELKQEEESGVIKHLLLTTQDDMNSAFVILDNSQR